MHMHGSQQLCTIKSEQLILWDHTYFSQRSLTHSSVAVFHFPFYALLFCCLSIRSYSKLTSAIYCIFSRPTAMKRLHYRQFADGLKLQFAAMHTLYIFPHPSTSVAVPFPFAATLHTKVLTNILQNNLLCANECACCIVVQFCWLNL